MTNLRETIDYYHSLLGPETARETHEHLTEQLLRRGLFFGDRPLSTVLRPRFIHPDQYRALQVGIRAVMPAFQKLHRAAMASPGFRSQFRLNDWEESLIQIQVSSVARKSRARIAGCIFDATPQGGKSFFAIVRG